METELRRFPSQFRKARWPILGLMFIICLFATPASAEKNNRSLVFVVDSSAKMEPYLSSVQEALLFFSLEAQDGDYISLVSFTDVVRQLGIRNIAGERDREYIGRRVESIRTIGDTAEILKGLERAAEDFEVLKYKGDRNQKGIIIISCSVSEKDESREEALKEIAAEINAQVKDDDEWFIQYCFLGGVGDQQIMEFVSSNRGFSYDVDALQSAHGTELIEELIGIISMPQESAMIKARDSSGILLGRESEDKKWVPLDNGEVVAENSQVRVSSDSRSVISIDGYGSIGLSPETNLHLTSARTNPITGETSIHMVLKEGSLWIQTGPRHKSTLERGSGGNAIEFSGTGVMATYSSNTNELGLASFLEPMSVTIGLESDNSFTLGINQAVRLVDHEITEDVSPAAPYMMEKWKSWSKAFSGGTSLAAIDFTVPEILFPEKTIQLGPIKSGDSLTRSFPILLSGVKDAKNLELVLETSLHLPEGLSLSTGIAEGEKEDKRQLMITVDGSTGFRSARAERHTGMLRIVPAPTSRIVFEKISIPVTVETKGPILPPSVLVIGGLAVVLCGCAIGASMLLRSRESARPKPYRVIGRLVIVNDPTGGRIGTINLEDISTKSSRLSLVIGRDRAAEIRLKHASISHSHCTIEAYIEDGKIGIYIEPIGSAKVRIDGTVIRSKTRLSDGSKIDIGEFSYQFEDSQLYKKVDVVYKNGRRMSGILDATAMDAEGCRLSPIDAVSTSERARVNFADIRQITFYRRPVDIISRRPRSTPKLETMKTVELMFRKGNIVKGRIQREYSEGQRKYIELLPLDPKSNIDYMLIDTSSIVEKKEI